MRPTIKTIERLAKTQPVREIELMLTLEELAIFGEYCTRNDIKFNDWVRQLAHDALEKEREGSKSTAHRNSDSE